MSTTQWRLERDYDKIPQLDEFTDRKKLAIPGLRLTEAQKQGKSDATVFEANKNGFINSSARLGDGGWHGKRFLGQGASADAGLWQKKDKHGDNIESVVIKQAYFDPALLPTQRLWGNSGLPTEMINMYQLNELNCNNIVRIKNFRCYKNQNIWRFYLEYCPNGNLWDLRTRYLAFASYFPEPFLWYTFKCLLNATTTMHDGEFRDTSWQKDRRLELLHLDFKDLNVFLGDAIPESDDPYEKVYPTMKLGDFGLSLLTRGKDKDNPDRLRGVGTDHYFFPEQSKTVIDAYPIRINKETEISGSAHVWAIGMLMWELMHVCEWPGTDHIRHRQDGNIVKPIRTGRDPEYSGELRDLVRQCLRANPDERPPIEDLQRQIDPWLIRLARTGLTDEKVAFKPEDFNDRDIGSLPVRITDLRDVTRVYQEDSKYGDRSFKQPVIMFDTVRRQLRILKPETGPLSPGFRDYFEMPETELEPLEQESGLRHGPNAVFGEDADDNGGGDHGGGDNGGGDVGGVKEGGEGEEDDDLGDVDGSSSPIAGPMRPPKPIARSISTRVPEAVRQQYNHSFPHGHVIVPTKGIGRARGYNATSLFLHKLHIRYWTYQKFKQATQLPAFHAFAHGDSRLFNLEAYDDRQLAIMLYAWGLQHGRVLRLAVLREHNAERDTAYFPFNEAFGEGSNARTVWVRDLRKDPSSGGRSIWAGVRRHNFKEKYPDAVGPTEGDSLSGRDTPPERFPSAEPAEGEGSHGGGTSHGGSIPGRADSSHGGDSSRGADESTKGPDPRAADRGTKRRKSPGKSLPARESSKRQRTLRSTSKKV